MFTAKDALNLVKRKLGPAHYFFHDIIEPGITTAALSKCHYYDLTIPSEFERSIASMLSSRGFKVSLVVASSNDKSFIANRFFHRISW